MTRISIAAALFLAVGAASAQTRTTELQARSYIHSAFITGAAHAILAPDVALGPQLREKLALPEGSDRDRIYEALFALTDEKALRVRKPASDEVAPVAKRAAGRPVFALEGGALPLVMVYDLERNAIPYVGILGAQAAAGATAADETPRLVRVAQAAPTPAPPTMPAAPTVIRLRPVAFAFDDATLSAEAKAGLERDGLPKMVGIREMRFVVQGHADRMGGARYNQRLSERRAEAVRDYLVEQGVAAQAIEVAGLGASMPTTSCGEIGRRALIDCLAPDRRVTVEIQPPPM